MDLLKNSGNQNGKVRSPKLTGGNNLPALGQGGNARTGGAGVQPGRAS
jgi:hypothetical protein